MWFKNLQVYKLVSWDITQSELKQELSKHALQECLSTEMQSRGWLPPKDGHDVYVHLLGKQMLIAFGVEKKILPSTVISQFAKSRASEIEERLGYKPSRKQMKEIKEEVTNELLPRAFSLRRKTYAWIDPVDGWFVIDSSNIARADELLETFRKTFDNFSLKFVKTQLSPSAAMTRWLSGDDIPSYLTIDRDCELRSIVGSDKSTVRYTRHTLDADEILRHIKAGKEVVRLSMTWRDRISFGLDEKFQLKRIAPLDFLKEETALFNEPDVFDSDFAIMTGEFKRLLPELISGLHGEI